MFTKPMFKERIEFTTANELEYILSAKGRANNKITDKIQETDVYKLTEDGQEFSRYLYYGKAAGYSVSFPNVTYYTYGGKQKIEEEDWSEIIMSCNISPHQTTPIDLTDLIHRRPELSYLISKYRLHDPEGKNIKYILKMIQAWSINPKIEPLIEIGQLHLAISKKLNKLTNEKLKDIIKFVNQNKDKYMLEMNKILYCMKQNIPYEMYSEVYPMGKRLYDYLKIQDRTYSYYKDYIKMAKEVGHNIKDNYWKYPKNLKEKHDLVMEQVTSIRETKRLIQLERNRKAQELRDKEEFELLSKIPKIAEYLKENNRVIDNYEILIPNSLEMIENQSKILNQCLITSNYHKAMAKQAKILVFILKDGIPQATAEVFYNKKVGQFYGDEKSQDRTLSLPSDEIKDVFYRWLETAKLKKLVFEEPSDIAEIIGGTEVGLQNVHQ